MTPLPTNPAEASFLVRTDTETAQVLYLTLRDWVAEQAQFVTDNAQSQLKISPPSWVVMDDLATNCESLARIARLAANLGQALGCGHV